MGCFDAANGLHKQSAIAGWNRRAQHIGEYAANGAIGEQEHPFAALCDLLPADVSWGDSLTPDIARHIVIAARAALTAEKVAAEPVGYAWQNELDALKNGEKIKCPLWAKPDGDEGEVALYAAPQQPAQPAGQDERAAFEAIHEFLGIALKRLYPTPDKPNSDWAKLRAAVDALALLEHRAASTQSTATQPAQTQVALTDEQVMSVSIINGEVTDYKYAGNLLDGEYPLYVVRHLTEGQAASILAAALRFETEGNKPMANDLRALLAAQPVSGADHD
jgi:hypothetical protein